MRARRFGEMPTASFEVPFEMARRSHRRTRRARPCSRDRGGDQCDSTAACTRRSIRRTSARLARTSSTIRAASAVVTPPRPRRVEFCRQRRGQRVEWRGVPHQTILRLEQQRSGAVAASAGCRRPQRDLTRADRADQAADQQRLAGAWPSRSPSACTRSNGSPRCRIISGRPSGSTGWLRQPSRARGPLERPDAIHDERQGRNGRVFSIHHACRFPSSERSRLSLEYRSRSNQ
jgi:hypothetical protein